MTADTELERHREDWHRFTRLFIYGTEAVVFILILMAWFLI